jgi:hypothetical protein
MDATIIKGKKLVRMSQIRSAAALTSQVLKNWLLVCIIWKSVSTLLPTLLSRRTRPPGSGGIATGATAPLNNARYF